MYKTSYGSDLRTKQYLLTAPLFRPCDFQCNGELFWYLLPHVVFEVVLCPHPSKMIISSLVNPPTSYNNDFFNLVLAQSVVEREIELHLLYYSENAKKLLQFDGNGTF